MMAIPDHGTDWFLAQLKPNSAVIAQRNLQRQGFQTFLPMGEETFARNGKFVTARRALFPGYIFVGFDAGQGLWRRVNSTQGITRLVAFGGDPAPVPPDLLAQLMQRCDGMGNLLPPPELTPGDRVTLAKGPFANFIAEIERIAPDQRVWLLLDLMGAPTRVAVDPTILRRVEQA
jgi:transcriptional antiterminator RfaH